MLRSFYSAVSGLGANQKSMDVIGNNIANVNTIGFKSGRAVFQDLMSQTLVGGKTPTDARGGINPRQVGSGTYLAAVDNIFEPGVLKSTNRTGDLGIEGEGLFVVRGEDALQRYYTRAGDFNFDKSGTLTNPSGYKVQGWMSDPITGKLNSDNTIGDIILGPEYQIMQAKASTEVNLAGTLDTRATASTLKFNQILTQATAQQSLDTLKGKGGVDLDLAKGEPVKILAHASTNTIMSNLYDKNEKGLGFSDGTIVTITINGTPHSISYTAGSGQDRGDEKFHTVEEFMEEVNNIFKQVGAASGTGPIAIMSLDNGSFKVEANSSFEITGISGTEGVTNLMSSLTGAYGVGVPKNSGDIFFMKEVKAYENFNNLSELGVQISNAINGNVVTDGFNVEFLTNNFGMKEGESFTIDNILIGDDSTGVVPPATPINIGPFVYTEEENPVAANKFHTVQELASLIKDAINTEAAAAGIANPPKVNFGIQNNKITLTHQSGGALAMGTTTMYPAPGGADPNPYLKTLLDGAFTTVNATGIATGKVLNDIQTYLDTDEISGKGRLVYNYAKTNNNLKLDFANGRFNMSNGDTLSFVIGGVDYTVAYGAADNAAVVPPVFNTVAGLQGALNAAFGTGATGLTVAWNPLGGVDGTGAMEFTAGGADVVVDSVKTTSTTPNLRNLFSSVLKNRSIPAGDTVSIAGEMVEVPTITGLKISKGQKNSNIFEGNMPQDESLGVNKSIASEQFLSVADENSKILDLFSGNGEAFDFVENEASINFNASVGGDKLTNNGYFNIQVGTTIQDLMDSIENYLGLGKDHNAFKNVTMEDGKIKITGEKGESNNIDFFEMSGLSSKYAAFNNYMSAPLESTKASKGTLATNVDIYDEQGNAHVVNFKFDLWNEEQNEWKLVLESDDPMNSVAINGATTNELIMKFNPDGSLAYMYDRYPDPATIIVNPTLRFSAANGTNTISNIALNLGSRDNINGMVLAAASSTFTVNSSDGYPQGNLETKMFNPAGEIVGNYTNGQVRVVGQVALATFTNQQGLLKVGDTMFAETGNSGQAVVGKPQTGSRGDISAGMLENSNVDLSMELVDMITTQRGFQANSKIISTSDEMIQELLNMKR